MPLLPDTSVRVREPEVMDDPALDGDAHHTALRGLERINLLSRSVASIWQRLKPLTPLRVLDIATGAGDVPIGLWTRARRAGCDLTIAGCDASERALAFARQRTSRHRADINWFTLDVLHQPIPSGYDAVTAGLFLHHLSDDDAAAVLAKMAAAASRLVVVSDLERSAVGYLAVSVGCRLLTRSSVVHADGPRSVRAAFTIDEARRLAERAGLTGAVIERRWPRRWLLTWSKR